MKRTYLFAALIALSLAACGKKPAEVPTTQTPTTAPSFSLPAGHPSLDVGKMAQAVPGLTLTQKGQVLSAMDVPQYTYIEVMQDNKTRWLAAPTVVVKKGDTIQFDDGNIMTNFNSKTLNRTFPSITFVVRVVIANEKM